MTLRVAFVGAGVIGLALYSAFVVHQSSFGIQQIEYHESHQVCDVYRQTEPPIDGHGATYECVLGREDPPRITIFRIPAHANWQDPVAALLAAVGVGLGVTALVKLRPDPVSA